MLKWIGSLLRGLDLWKIVSCNRMKQQHVCSRSVRFLCYQESVVSDLLRLIFTVGRVWVFLS